ncbi:MAG: T9SS type A sorting domain-containing protein [Bacteroidales bacterium]|nr:T9SS type A sorting domain-containing protein [Bacteroidales bacterium]
MKKIFLILLLITLTVNIKGQDCCGTTADDNIYSRTHCERMEPSNWEDSLLLLSNFIPRDDTFPVISIKVNVHIFRKDDGTGNRWLDTEEYRDSLRMMFDYANQISSTNCIYSESIPNAEFIPDSKYRFILDSIYYYNNTALAYASDNNPINNFLLANYPERLNNYALHMNLFSNCDYSGKSTLNSNIQSCLFVKCYTGHYSGLWANALLLNHEIGHNFGLHHPYGSEETDLTDPEFLWDLFGTTKQSWCENPTNNEVCYHDGGWDCDINDPSATCTNNIMGGNKDARHFTALQCARIHRSLRMGNIRKHAYGYTDVPKVIDKNENWDFNYKSYQDIIVNSNVTLTISCRLEMVAQAKIIIKPGGKLIIDGGTITNAHYEGMWQGIQVWGNENMHQNMVNGRYLQGVLELKNGATIENAVCAVDLWNPLDEHSEGGIVWAEDATFRNNAKAVRSLNYSNYSPSSGTEAQNASWFRNCSFILDSEYIGNETFHNHVELNNVDGIKFYACSFSADNSVSQLASSISAIYASSAGFTVTSECSSPSFPCPENNLIYSTFNGFDNAIHVTNNGGSVRTFSVSNSEFWNNERGIYATNTGYATIIKNIFNVGNNAQCNYGVYVDGVTNFCIEENNFLRNPSTTNRTYGIAVENSGSYNDIYLNHFNNLYCGNISIGNNIVSGNNGLGLTYTCNTNSGNTHDFGVLRDGTYGNIDNSQGSSSLAAANTFSASQYHFYNKGNNNLTYYYKGNGNKIPSRKYGVTLSTASIDNECKSHYDPIGGGSGGGMMSVGKTDSLKNKYENSFSSFNRLNSLGTYKIEKDSTQKMLQEAQMSMLQRECLLAAGDIVRSNLNKEERDFNELREWLGKSNDISSARMIIASYIQQKDFVNAIALAKKLPATYDLQGEELNEFYDYLEIIRLHESLSETNRTALQLSDYEVTLLENIAENGTGASKAMADAILAENRGLPTIVITLCPTIPNFASVARGSGESEMTSDTAFKVELSPNPATTNVEVSYTLPEGMTSATLVMTNTLGVNVMTAHLDGNNGETTLSLEELPSGIYYYTIKCGEDVKTGKLVKRN